MFRVDLRDVMNGLVVAVLAPLFLSVTAVVGAVILAPGFDVFSVEWFALGKNLLNSSIVVSYSAFTGYIIKNFFTNTQGSFAGITPKN